VRHRPSVVPLTPRACNQRRKRFQLGNNRIGCTHFLEQEWPVATVVTRRASSSSRSSATFTCNEPPAAIRTLQMLQGYIVSIGPGALEKVRAARPKGHDSTNPRRPMRWPLRWAY
jgi:hypothetical protein